LVSLQLVLLIALAAVSSRGAQSGAVDISFDARLNEGAAVGTILPLEDGKVISGGVFSSVAGVNQWSVARWNEDGTLDSARSKLRSCDLQPVTLPASGLVGVGLGWRSKDGKLIVGSISVTS
jgi:hypothetical protein